MANEMKTCPVCECETSYLQPIYDARGIYCGCSCGSDKCEAEIKAKYRPEIFTDSQYECDEQIDED